MNTLQRLLSNTLLAFVSSTVARISGSILFILVGRQLGPDEAGIFNLGVTAYTILVALSSWGLHELMVREVAPRRDESGRYLVNYVVLRLFISTLLYGLLLLFLQLNLPYTPETKTVLGIIALAVFPEAVFSLCQALFVAHEEMAVPTTAALVDAVVRLGLGLWLLATGLGAVAVAWAIPISTSVALLVFIPALVRLFRRVPQRVSIGFDWRFVRHQLSFTYGFFLLEIYAVLHFQADTFIISFLMTEADVGYYGAAQTILAGFLMIPTAVRMGLYPLMARYQQTDETKLIQLYRKSSHYLIIGSLPLAAGVTLLAAPVIFLLFGTAFAPAVPALQWSIWAVVFAVLTVPNARLMLVNDRQTDASWLRGGTVVLAVALDLFLIPRAGIVGASIARLIATAAFFLALYLYVQRRLLAENILPLVARPLLATALMSLAVYPLRNLPLPIPVLTGAAVYTALILLLGVVTEEDRVYLRQLLNRRAKTAT